MQAPIKGAAASRRIEPGNLLDDLNAQHGVVRCSEENLVLAIQQLDEAVIDEIELRILDAGVALPSLAEANECKWLAFAGSAFDRFFDGLFYFNFNGFHDFLSADGG